MNDTLKSKRMEHSFHGFLLKEKDVKQCFKQLKKTIEVKGMFNIYEEIDKLSGYTEDKE